MMLFSFPSEGLRVGVHSSGKGRGCAASCGEARLFSEALGRITCLRFDICLMFFVESNCRITQN